MADEQISPRVEAAKARLKKYQGEPCSRGHDGVRYTSTGSCVDCAKLATASNNDRIRKLLNGEAV